MDFELVRSCYWADATDDHGSFRGSVEEFLEWIGRQLPRNDATTHSLSNILIEGHPTNPDVARVESYGAPRGAA
jgi:hypothetical protein